jgi:hypothetical protein
MQGSGDAAGIKLGQNLVLGGLGIQLFALFFFVLTVGVVHRRLNAEPTYVTKSSDAYWQRHFWTLHSASALIIVRNMFRLIEFAAAHNNVLATKEVFLYVFDAAVMALVVYLLVIVHPGRLLRSIKNSSLSELDMGASQRLG